MKYIKKFEENNIDKIPNFAIDIRNCSDDDLMRILNILGQIAELYFNGASNKNEFINHKDTQGRAWCWTVEPEYWSNTLKRLYISGVHTRGWYREDLMGHIIYGKDFTKLGFEESIMILQTYPEYDADYKNMIKNANKYNI